MSQPLHLVCQGCGAVNRVPPQRPPVKAKCGTCHQILLSGVPLPLDSARFERFVRSSSLPLVVDFWAPWCGPCRMMEQVFVQAARRLQGKALFIKINTEEEQALASRFQIAAVPTLMIFKQGQAAARMSGALDLQGLLGWVERAL